MCLGCKKPQTDYGFKLEKDNYYMTTYKPVKSCCPIKVYVIDITDKEVTFTHKDKQYIESIDDFMKSSWRVYGSF